MLRKMDLLHSLTAHFFQYCKRQRFETWRLKREVVQHAKTLITALYDNNELQVWKIMKLEGGHFTGWLLFLYVATTGSSAS